jgi:regulatory protein
MSGSGPPAPDRAALLQAALSHLARYASTEAGLRRVLLRRIERWAAAQGVAPDEAARAEAGAVVADLVRAGAVSDAQYAEAAARSQERAGRSRRAILAKLAAKGVAGPVAAEAAPENSETEIAAALVTARRRRVGPFRTGAAPDAAGRLKEMGRLARAGFSRAVAEAALDMDREEAERVIEALRR